MLFLLLETGMIGCFVALDFFLFYIFWEVMLLPMYFLIGVWGGPRREYAAIKFFLYTLLGSVFILIALLGLLLHRRAGFRQPGRGQAAGRRPGHRRRQGGPVGPVRRSASTTRSTWYCSPRPAAAMMHLTGQERINCSTIRPRRPA